MLSLVLIPCGTERLCGNNEGTCFFGALPSLEAHFLSDYLKFMEQYSEMTKKMEEWNDGTLNDAELKYYLDTMNRVTQKLLEIT